MSKVVILDGHALNPGDLSWDKYKRLGSLVIRDHTAENEVIDVIGDADIVITNKTPVNKNVFDACKNIAYIGVLATGYDVVDIEAARQHGVVVTNVPNYGSDSVSQFAIALLLEICDHVAYHSDLVKKNEWGKREWCFWDKPIIELANKTMGIIGFGHIGQKTAKIAKAMGMNIQYYDEYSTREFDYASKCANLNQLFSSSDVVVLHCPLTNTTRNIINCDTIKLMKTGAILINNARGGLVDCSALAEALLSGKLYAAGLDVVDNEPIHEDNPLLKCDNCIITPHISWASKEARQRIMDMAFDNIDMYLKGSAINSVN